jgi:hypothetical protein
VSVDVYSEWLSAFGAHRADALADEGLIDRIYAYVGPENEAARSNRKEWSNFARFGVVLWGWYVCSPDQEADAEAIVRLDSELKPAGWLLNIEKPLERVELRPLVSRVAALGKPMVASLAGLNPNHHLYDHRTLDRFGVEQEWQCYFDSGEGPRPDVAVRELYLPSRVRSGREYRALTWPTGLRKRAVYGWGDLWSSALGRWLYDSYNAGVYDWHGHLTDESGWPPTVVADRALTSFARRGRLLGLARYSKIRVALDVTRGAAERHTLDQWTAIAASARLPGLRKRPVSIYLAEVCPTDVLRAIAEGAE